MVFKRLSIQMILFFWKTFRMIFLIFLAQAMMLAVNNLLHRHRQSTLRLFHQKLWVITRLQPNLLHLCRYQSLPHRCIIMLQLTKVPKGLLGPRVRRQLSQLDQERLQWNLWSPMSLRRALWRQLRGPLRPIRWLSQHQHAQPVAQLNIWHSYIIIPTISTYIPSSHNPGSSRAFRKPPWWDTQGVLKKRLEREYIKFLNRSGKLYNIYMEYAFLRIIL